LPWQRTSGHREEESQPEGEAAEGEDDWIPVRWPEEEDKSKEGRLEKTSAAMDEWMHWRRNLTAKGSRRRGLLREEFWYTEIENTSGYPRASHGAGSPKDSMKQLNLRTKRFAEIWRSESLR